MTMTEGKFFAAARIIVGPPMSMFSKASSSVTPGLRIVSTKGYRFPTTTSMPSMPRSLSSATWESKSRLARIPAWMTGCRVLTRPSRISGNPVTSESSVTGSPAAVSSPRVPPVLMISNPASISFPANSTAPVLS